MTAPSPAICVRKLALLDAYEEATRVYSAALTRLRSSMGTSPQEEYEAAYRSVELLRMDARMAQEQLDRHVSTHRC